MAEFESASDTTEPKPRVYFCFAAGDSTLADGLRDSLIGEIDPSRPDQLLSGGSLADDYRLQFGNTDIVILIATDEARRTVGGQLRQAIEMSKPIIVVQLYGTTLANWEPIADALLHRAVTVSLTSSTLPQDFIDNLSDAISTQWREILKARDAAPPEDLKRIRGIGVLIEKRLNALGVTRYEHIANWSAADVERMSDRLEFKGRIERESWVEQAKILATGGETEFSKQVDRPAVSTEVGPPPTRISVFISSSRADREEAARLANRLKHEDLEVYWDERIELGERWQARIDSFLQKADAIIVLFSDNALASRVVRDEAEFARLHQNIVPVLARDFSAASLPPPFNDLYAAKIDEVLADPRKVVQAIERCAEDRRALNKLTPRQAESILSEPASAEQASVKTAHGTFVPFAQLKKIVDASAAVVAIQDAAGRTIGDGFFIDPPVFGSRLNGSASYVLTSAQLVWDSLPLAAPQTGKALAPDDVRIVSYSTTDDGVSETYRCVRVVWQSSPEKLNAVLIELDRPILDFKLRRTVQELARWPRPFLSDMKVIILGHAMGGSLSLSRSALNFGAVMGADEKAGVFSYPVGYGDAAAGSPIVEEENLRVVGIHQSRDPSNPQIGRTVYIRSIVDAVRQHLAILSLARDWRASGAKKSGLLKAAKLESIDAQLLENPLSPWMASEVEPFLTASRRALLRSSLTTRRAFAATLAALPLLGGIAADRWIANVSVALSPPNSARSSRIDNFLNPAATTTEGPMRAARSRVREWLVPRNAHQSAIRDLVTTRDGKFAAVLSADNTVKLWDLDGQTMKWAYRVADEFEGLVLGLDYSNAKTSVLLFSLDIDTSNDKPGSMTPQRMYGDTTAIDIATGAAEKKTDFDPTLQLRRARMPASADPDFSPGMVLSASQTDFAELDVTLKGYADGTIAVNGTEAEAAMKHASPVRAIASSDDGSLGASAAADGSAILWTAPSIAASGSGAAWTAMALERRQFGSPMRMSVLLETLSADTAKVTTEISPDGSRVASTDAGRLRIWDSRTARLLCSAEASSPGGAVSFSPDSNSVSAIANGRLFMWDAATCEFQVDVQVQEQLTTAGKFSPDGSKIAVAAADSSVRIWSRAGYELGRLSGHTSNVFDIQFSPDGTKILTASLDKTARVWDAQTGQELLALRGHEDGVTSITMSPQGRTIATASADNTVRLWDAASGQLLTTLQGHSDAILSVKFSPDGTHILTTSRDRTAMLWNAASRQLVAKFDHPAQFVRADFSSDGRFIYSYATAFGESQTPTNTLLKIYDGKSGRVVSEYEASREISSVRFERNGEDIVLTEGSAVTRVALIRSSCGGPCSAASFSKDGKWLLTSGWGGQSQVWSASGESKGQLLAELRHGDAVNTALFVESADVNANREPIPPSQPTRIVTAGDDGTAKLWQLTRAEQGFWWPSLIATIRGHDAPITHAELTPDARTLVTGDMRGNVRKTDLAASVLLSNVDVTPAIEQYLVPAYNFASGGVASLGRRGWSAMIAMLPQTSQERAKSDVVPTPAPEPTLSNEQIARLMSPEARQLIIGFEVTSQDAYEKKYAKPILPGGQSGLVIGIGYDVGYVTADDVASNWAGLLPEATIERLKRAAGLRGADAQALLPELSDINVPWDAAIEAFERLTVPRYGRQVLALFPNAQELDPHAFGALFSLVYNRGSSLQGERRQEMLNIRNHMAAREFNKIPNEIRAMKRLWTQAQLSGMLKRREAEAVLFERGLERMQAGGAPSAQQIAPMPQSQQ